MPLDVVLKVNKTCTSAAVVAVFETSNLSNQILQIQSVRVFVLQHREVKAERFSFLID
eukprot:m.364073 g.364073  ORF g.364073 m.364073 type:complete len:58 (-) comp25225_c0_seq1:56-229(-)